MQTAEEQVPEEYMKIMDDYHRVMNDHYKQASRHNTRILKAVGSVKGNAFRRNLIEAIKDSEANGEKMQLVKKPKGNFVKAKYGRQIPGYWCDQWNVGYECDCFEGTVTFKLKDEMYLEVPFSC